MSACACFVGVATFRVLSIYPSITNLRLSRRSCCGAPPWSWLLLPSVLSLLLLLAELDELLLLIPHGAPLLGQLVDLLFLRGDLLSQRISC